MKIYKDCHDKYMFFDIIFILGIIFVVGFIIPGIVRNQSSFTRIIIWIIVVIITVGVTILRAYIAKRDYDRDKKKD